MKLDYDLIANMLAHIKEVGDGATRHTITRSTFSSSQEHGETYEICAYHFDILIEN